MEGPWTKWGVVCGFAALIVTYIGTAAGLHWFPFRQVVVTNAASQAGSLPSSLSRTESGGATSSIASPKPAARNPIQSLRPTSLETGKHFLINDDSGSCLDQDYTAGVRHQDILSYPCRYNINEVWDVTLNSNLTYSFTNAASGECLNQDYLGGVPHDNVMAYQCGAYPSQDWRAVQAGGLTYLVNQESGGCLDQDWTGGIPSMNVLSYSPCSYGLNEVWSEK